MEFRTCPKNGQRGALPNILSLYPKNIGVVFFAALCAAKNTTSPNIRIGSYSELTLVVISKVRDSGKFSAEYFMV